MINNGSQLHPTAYACKKDLTFNRNLPAVELKSKTDRFLCEMIDELQRSGCKLVGHIKGLIDADVQGHFVFSITSFDEGIRFKGQMENGIKLAALTVNAIVYGIEYGMIETVFEKTFHKHFR